MSNCWTPTESSETLDGRSESGEPGTLVDRRNWLNMDEMQRLVLRPVKESA